MLDAPPRKADFAGHGDFYIRGGSDLAMSFDVLLDGEKVEDRGIRSYDCDAGVVLLHELDQQGRPIIIDNDVLKTVRRGRVEVRWNERHQPHG